MKKAIPCALIMFVNILVVLVLHESSSSTLTNIEFTTLCTLLLTIIGFVNLIWICVPFNWLKAICVAVSAVLISCAVSGFGKFFSITEFSFPVVTTLITLFLCTAVVLVGVYYLKEWINAQPEGSGWKTFWNKLTGIFRKKQKKTKSSTEQTVADIEVEAAAVGTTVADEPQTPEKQKRKTKKKTE